VASDQLSETEIDTRLDQRRKLTLILYSGAVMNFNGLIFDTAEMQQILVD